MLRGPLVVTGIVMFTGSLFVIILLVNTWLSLSLMSISPMDTGSPVRLVTVTCMVTLVRVLFIIVTLVMVGIFVTSMFIGLIPSSSVALHALYISFSLYCTITLVIPVVTVGMVILASPFIKGISVRPLIGLPCISVIFNVPFVTRFPVMLVMTTFTVVLPIVVSSTVTCPCVGILFTSIFMLYSSGSPSCSELFLALLGR